MPKKRTKKEFYSSLNYEEMLGPDMLDKLDALMDGLLARIDAFYHQDRYVNDLERATISSAALMVRRETSCIICPRKRRKKPG